MNVTERRLANVASHETGSAIRNLRDGIPVSWNDWSDDQANPCGRLATWENRGDGLVATGFCFCSHLPFGTRPLREAVVVATERAPKNMLEDHEGVSRRCMGREMVRSLHLPSTGRTRSSDRNIRIPHRSDSMDRTLDLDNLQMENRNDGEERYHRMRLASSNSGAALRPAEGSKRVGW